MAEKDNANLSGAPDKTEEVEATPIWNENNVLVDSELDAHFKEERERVLGIGAFEPSPDEDRSGLAVLGIRDLPPPNTPEIVQRLPSQTEDPLSNPRPTADPNNRPSPLAALPEERERMDKAILEAAKSGDNEAEVNLRREIENTEGSPLRGDELGNVRGNPTGAEGGVRPSRATEPIPVEDVPPPRIPARTRKESE